MARSLSILYWLLVAAIAISMFPVALLLRLLTTPFDRRLAILHAFTNLWGTSYLWLNPRWRVQLRGRHHIEPGRTYVIVSNHLSIVDVFVVHRLFCHFKWVSKAENFRIPCIGWNMVLNRYIPVRRGDRGSVAEMFTRCRSALARGSSVMMFPEGTRSRDGALRPFKPGAFQLARDVRVPVLPIAIQGTFGALEPKTFVIAPARIRVTVFPAISAHDIEQLSVDALSNYVRARIAAELDS